MRHLFSAIAMLPSNEFMDEFLGGGDGVTGDAMEVVSGLQEVGALSEVGAQAMKAALTGTSAAAIKARLRSMGKSVLSSPNFARSARETERRAPLGFTAVGGASSFALAAAIGAVAVMTAKVSRVAHVDRLLIIPSLAGAVLDSIKVGDEEQVLAAGAPVELYGVQALTDSLPDNFSPLGQGLDLIVSLRNTTAAAITGTIGAKCSVKR